LRGVTSTIYHSRAPRDERYSPSGYRAATTVGEGDRLKADKAILLVDDEAIILLALRQELRSELGPSYRYEIAGSADEGLAVIGELGSDGVRVVLVISDWLMPGMKGDEFLMLVRRLHPEIRTMMVSGQTDEDQLDKLKASDSLDVFIKKPWNPDRLVAECRRLLE
jgi:DNA-binding NtrC family response regulator